MIILVDNASNNLDSIVANVREKLYENVKQYNDDDYILFGNLIRLNPEQIKHLEQFRSTHCGDVEIVLKLGGGIGIIVELRCTGCSGKFDLTDYDRW